MDKQDQIKIKVAGRSRLKEGFGETIMVFAALITFSFFSLRRNSEEERNVE